MTEPSPVGPPLRLAYLADPNSVHSRRWLSFFARRGHDVSLLVQRGRSVATGLDPGVEVVEYDRFGPIRLPFVSSLQGRGPLREALSRLAPDVLHAHYLVGYGWQARLSGFHPFVATAWGSDVFVAPGRSLRTRLWNRATLRGADLVTVNSAVMSRAALAAGARPDRVVEVQFGIDTERFAPGPADTTLRQRLGLGTGPIVFGLRAISPIYHPETIVRAFGMLDRAATLVLSGRNADPGCRASLEADIRGLGLSERVRILPGIADDDLVALLRETAVAVSVPDSDGTPSSVVEAMAVGAPLVLSELSTLRELVGSASAVRWVPAGDAGRLASALSIIIAEPDEIRRTGTPGMRERAVRCCDQRSNMLRMEEHYRRLATGTRR